MGKDGFDNILNFNHFKNLTRRVEDIVSEELRKITESLLIVDVSKKKLGISFQMKPCLII